MRTILQVGEWVSLTLAAALLLGAVWAIVDELAARVRAAWRAPETTVEALRRHLTTTSRLGDRRWRGQ